MTQQDVGFEPQIGRRRLKTDIGYAVAEDVVHPSDAGRLRGYRKISFDQSLVVAVPRPKHHAMLSKANRPRIRVSGDMPDAENCHESERCRSIRRLLGTFVLPCD